MNDETQNLYGDQEEAKRETLEEGIHAMRLVDITRGKMFSQFTQKDEDRIFYHFKEEDKGIIVKQIAGLKKGMGGGAYKRAKNIEILAAMCPEFFEGKKFVTWEDLADVTKQVIGKEYLVPIGINDAGWNTITDVTEIVPAEGSSDGTKEPSEFDKDEVPY